MASCGKETSNISGQECCKIDDKTCKISKMCKLQTPEGEFDCECICTCKCSSGDCNKCVCKCKCTLENAQKIQTADGVKYKCECKCEC